MGIGEAARLLGVSEDWVRRWIDANEPDPESPDPAVRGRVPVAERVRDDGGPVPRRWRRPYRDAVEAEARRRRGELTAGGEAPTEPAG
jgi:hypothetical protein